MEIHQPADQPSTAERRPETAKRPEMLRTGIIEIQRRRQSPQHPQQGVRAKGESADCGAVFWYWATRQDR